MASKEPLVVRLTYAIDEFFGRRPCGLLGEARDRIESLELTVEQLISFAEKVGATKVAECARHNLTANR